MIDIFVSSQSGVDLGSADTQTYQAGNILSVQVTSLEYAQSLGIDLSFFLSSDFSFQNESFKAYLIETLAISGINVSTLEEIIEDLDSQYIFNLSPPQTNTDF
jgi:hypothetical protein